MDFACLKEVTSLRQFPLGEAGTYTHKGRTYNMYFIWAVRHLFVRDAYDCGNTNCVGYGAYISIHDGRCVVRCREKDDDGQTMGCNKINYTPYPDSELMKGSVEKNIVYLACLVWGQPCILSRHEAGMTSRRATFINRRFARLCACHNAREFLKRAGTLTNVQADETAIGSRKYNNGKRVRKEGVVWVAGCVEVGEDGTQQMFCSVVVDRKAESLGAVMKPLLRPGAVFTSDSWRAYKKMLGDLEVEHRMVNHSKEYVTKEGHHTNHIEAMWRVLKKELKQRFSRCGVNDISYQDDRIQFAVWIINERLGETTDTILQAAVRLFVDADETEPKVSVAADPNAKRIVDDAQEEGVEDDGLPVAEPVDTDSPARGAAVVNPPHSDGEEPAEPVKKKRGRPPKADGAAKRGPATKVATKKTA
jgi:hypothetical protein